MIELLGETTVHHPLFTCPLENVLLSDGAVVFNTKNTLFSKHLGASGVLRTLSCDSPITALHVFSPEHIMVGLASGKLLVVASDQLRVAARVALKNAPIVGFAQDSLALYIVHAPNTLVAVERAVFDAPENIESILLQSSCYYEVPMAVVAGVQSLSEALHLDGWPETKPVPSSACSTLMLAGTTPMCLIVRLPPTSEALNDPVGVAADLIRSTVTSFARGWLGGAGDAAKPVSPKPKYLVDRMSLGYLDVLLAIEDPGRSVAKIVPTGSSEKYILFDEQHGRALLLDASLGLIAMQFKGLRGCQVAMAGEEQIVALNSKHLYLDIINIRTGRTGSRHEIPTTDGVDSSHLELLPRAAMLQVHTVEAGVAKIQLYKITAAA